MPIPTGGDTPSRYKPNRIDDQATGCGSTYLSLATAIEEIERIYEDRDAFVALDKRTRQAIRTAESGLRRAAFGLVIHYKEAG